jgi:hypothetical protein
MHGYVLNHGMLGVFIARAMTLLFGTAAMSSSSFAAWLWMRRTYCIGDVNHQRKFLISPTHLLGVGTCRSWDPLACYHLEYVPPDIDI